ncbi:prephenate dehydrogenase [Metabacillus fastidiosus]|uniref:Prephenate dehydrogenase n=1 Tax=Metabacillus fastidiosus TaxID=1458 RepID=A0ABU6NWC9_9BACI|nr:prephenate dehydrogenase [Metabacillus fastidiosus]MED4400697.1 prephenate dehydrogenase [Metabacillus fastidiosus]MED4453728.1 prephenate dehydrogenase [Metabacillus fastidiosus]MED4462868.1 prephenate dehydrogenase [Metabacillus fastidiosus]MED4532180.1 prephenate dehydrogenase [Metabacillus fastidiosus]
MGKTVYIIGLGLIGGSIALAIKRDHPDVHIIGYDINKNQCSLAEKIGVIDECSETKLPDLEHVDVIFISTPVEETLKIIRELKDVKLKKGVIITDVGSTKEKIIQCAEQELSDREIVFIGGHPMAGSHKSGVVAARPHLFENAFYIFTPTEKVPAEKIEELIDLIKGTKANFIELSPVEHDQITGVISHFPHIVAAGLVFQAEKYEEKFPLVKRLAAGGFRDITRIASSNPAMWRDILIHNRNSLLQLFDDWIEEMNRLKEFVAKEQGDELFSYFNNAKQYRDELPEKQKGAIPSFYDLYIDVPDYPGIISEVTGYLAKEEISLTNIRIIETREEIYGVLRLSFQTERDRENAIKCISKYSDYETFIV